MTATEAAEAAEAAILTADRAFREWEDAKLPGDTRAGARVQFAVLLSIAKALRAGAEELHSILLVLDSPEQPDELPRYRAEPDGDVTVMRAELQPTIVLAQVDVAKLAAALMRVGIVLPPADGTTTARLLLTEMGIDWLGELGQIEERDPLDLMAEDDQG